jgi:hypothetical protein
MELAVGEVEPHHLRVVLHTNAGTFGRSARSSTVTLAPARRAVRAAHKAAFPPPMTRTSDGCSCIDDKPPLQQPRAEEDGDCQRQQDRGNGAGDEHRQVTFADRHGAAELLL